MVECSTRIGKWKYRNVNVFGLCCLMTPGLSKDIQCHV